MTTTPVLPSLPEPSAHMLPSDLTKFKTSETWSQAFSVAVVNPDERSEPLFTAEQMNEHARRAIESLSRAPARPSDDQLWDQTLRERDNYHEWADKLADSISRFIGLDIGEHSSANNPWARAIDMIPRGTLTEALASRAPAEPADYEPIVEVWHEGRKVTVYPPRLVLRVWGPNIVTEMSDEPFSLRAVQQAMDWLYAHPTESAGPAPAGMLLVSEAALRQIARAIEGLKRECGMDPESPQAIRNAQYMSLAYAVRKLGESHE